MINKIKYSINKKLKEGEYDPKSYVEENLSLKRSAEILLDFIK